MARRPMKELKFIHITKTAGTSIENVGLQNGISWGRFHYEYGPWHQLPSTKSSELIKKYDWFLVYRNPYERIISEFHCIWGGLGGNAFFATKEEFNTFIQESIRKIKPEGDHYTPQYLYMRGVIGFSKLYILNFENLQNDFQELMNEYKIDVKLNQKANVCGSGLEPTYEPIGEKKFSIEDLDKNSIDLINQVYDLDFRFFKYNKL